VLEYIFFPLLIVVTLLVVLCAMRLIVALERFRIRRSYTSALNAPSVSVCIPARNEMHVMAECLERVLASDYQKIEVIVFDDSSSDDTSILVKSFAHAGVRFVPGRELPDGWLGKNHALSILAEEASGSKLLFLDVDTSIDTTTISQLVSYMETEQLSMVSVLPMRRDGWSVGVLFGYMRFYWELIIAGRSLPATSSGLWMIDRAVLLDECGGFTPLASDVRPEQRLAERLGTHRYHCLLGTEALGVAEQKPWHSQLEAGRRLLYPIVGGTRLAGFGALVMILLFNVPAIGLIVGLALGRVDIAWWSFGLVVTSMATYALYTARTRSRGWLAGALLWPVLVVQEVYLLLTSLIGYATNTVTWKGRPVTAKSAKTDYYVIDK
jgi:glycosyltransferase involved in cell wall biosynthesis